MTFIDSLSTGNKCTLKPLLSQKYMRSHLAEGEGASLWFFLPMAWHCIGNSNKTENGHPPDVCEKFQGERTPPSLASHFELGRLSAEGRAAANGLHNENSFGSKTLCKSFCEGSYGP